MTYYVLMGDVEPYTPTHCVSRWNRVLAGGRERQETDLRETECDRTVRGRVEGLHRSDD